MFGSIGIIPQHRANAFTLSVWYDRGLHIAATVIEFGVLCGEVVEDYFEDYFNVYLHMIGDRSDNTFESDHGLVMK